MRRAVEYGICCSSLTHKPAVEILPGTVIHIPANVKHWHGAAADSWFAHLAFEVSGENTSNEWLEPVTDDEYNKLEQTKR